jgi:hypothetical protein
MFRKGDPKKRMVGFFILAAAVFLMVVGEMFLIGPDSMLVTLLVVMTALCLLMCYNYYWLPKLQYNKMAHLRGAVNTYTFREEDILIATRGEGFNGESTVAYNFIVKAMETRDYFFLYQTKATVYLVDKSTVSSSKAVQLRKKLQASIGGKYILCDY